MFTGIIQGTGVVKNKKRNFIAIEVNQKIARIIAVGGSVSVDGVCLTALKCSAALHASLKRGIKPRATGGIGTLTFELMDSTLKRTTLGKLKHGAIVNVEPALRAGEPLGGHFVSGHIDGVGVVYEIKKQKQTQHIKFKISKKLSKYIIPRGSVAINGVSLTVVGAQRLSLRSDRGSTSGCCFSVALTDYTLQNTNLVNLKKGDKVNVEVDLLAKYLEKLCTQ